MKRIIMLSLAFAAMSVAPISSLAQWGPQKDFDDKYATELVKTGTKAPDFKLKTSEGKTLKLSSFKGKYVVLDFWASWCPDCRKDIPEVQRMYNKFHAKGVEFVGVSFDTNKDAWVNALKKYGIVYPQVSELKKMRESAVAQSFGVKWIPSMVLVNPKGEVELSTVLSYKMEKKLTELTASQNKPLARVRQDIIIEGSKGKLAAYLVKPEGLKEGEKAPLAILMHGFSGNKEGQMEALMADSLQKYGIGSIRFDFNGHGKSEGAFSEMTVPNEIEDAKKVYEYACSLPWVDASRIAIEGHSQGGVVTSMLAGELGAEKIKAVVLMAPAAVLREDAIRGNTMGAQYDPLDPPAEGVKLYGNLVLGANYIRTAFSLPIYETAAKYTGPACIVHGTADRVVPYTYGERYHKLWAGSELHILDMYDHGFSQNVYYAAELASEFIIKKLK